MLLPMIRESIGMPQDSFLIPADAHEFLLHQPYMVPEQFLSLCSGNILEEDHHACCHGTIDVSKNGTTQQILGCLFFHEHVITILQLRREKEQG